MDALFELKMQFADKMIRFRKATAYMDGPATAQEKEKWQPEYLKLLHECCELEYKLKGAGCKMSDKEIWRAADGV